MYKNSNLDLEEEKNWPLTSIVTPENKISTPKIAKRVNRLKLAHFLFTFRTWLQKSILQFLEWHLKIMTLTDRRTRHRCRRSTPNVSTPQLKLYKRYLQSLDQAEAHWLVWTETCPRHRVQKNIDSKVPWFCLLWEFWVQQVIHCSE